MNSVQM